MRRIAIILACLTLAGCSSFKLGAVLYCPHGQQCVLQAGPVASAAR